MLAQAKNLDEQNQLIKDDALLKRQQALTEVNRSFREGQAADIDRQRLELDKALAASNIKLQIAQSRNYDSNSAYTALRNYQDSLNTNALEHDSRTRRTTVGGWFRGAGTMLGDALPVRNFFKR